MSYTELMKKWAETKGKKYTFCQKCNLLTWCKPVEKDKLPVCRKCYKQEYLEKEEENAKNGS
jgi:uncharacterized paraquat-inducible protein A